MLEKFFDSSARGLSRVRSLRNGLHGSQLDSFAKELFHSRYANITVRKHLRSAEHFILGEPQPHPVAPVARRFAGGFCASCATTALRVWPRYTREPADRGIAIAEALA